MYSKSYILRIRVCQACVQELNHYCIGIIKDINNVRVECSICCKNAPSQSPAAPNIPDIPSTPFEYVFVDFFDVSNHHYLIAGDLLSGWVEVFSSSSGTSKSGAAGLISHLRSFFATFGVPVVGQSKKMKHFLFDCVGPAGSLNSDKFLQGMLHIRNTPDPDCKLSPAQISFGRPLRDAFSFINRIAKFQNSAIVWHEAWNSRETSLRTRFNQIS